MTARFLPNRPAIAQSCLLIATLSLMPRSLPATDYWPVFRGPTENGHALRSDPPIEWSETHNVVWKTAIPGEGWSTPVISQGDLFLTAAVPTGETGAYSLRLIALEANSGNHQFDVEVFSQPANAPKIHSKNSHASPSAVIDGDRVYVHFGHQGTACLSRQGEVLWRNQEFSYAPVHGNGGSPLLTDQTLIFSCDGSDETFVVGLDKATGKPVWRTPRKTDARRTFSFSTPALIEAGGQQLISPGSNTVDALDPSTGQLIWRVRYDGYSLIPQPVFGHGLVFVCTGYDRPSLLAIDPTGRGDVTESHVVWRNGRHIPHTPSVLLVGDELYLVSDRGVATCRDAKTGRIHWQERLPGAYSASPIYAAGRIYFLNEEGVATVIRADTSFVRLASNSVNERTLASFAAVEERLYLRGDKHLFCLSR